MGRVLTTTTYGEGPNNNNMGKVLTTTTTTYGESPNNNNNKKKRTVLAVSAPGEGDEVGSRFITVRRDVWLRQLAGNGYAKLQRLQNIFDVVLSMEKPKTMFISPILVIP